MLWPVQIAWLIDRNSGFLFFCNNTSYTTAHAGKVMYMIAVSMDASSSRSVAHSPEEPTHLFGYVG